MTPAACLGGRVVYADHDFDVSKVLRGRARASER